MSTRANQTSASQASASQARAYQVSASASEHAVDVDSRFRRWWVIAAIVVMALGLYVIGLAWVAKHLETGVENSIRLAPAITRASDAVIPVTSDPGTGALVGVGAATDEPGDPR